MSFIWPAMLGLLVLVPLAIYAYVVLGRRRAGRAAMLGALGVTPASTGRLGRRSQIAPALVFAGLAIAIVGLARPQAVVSVPRFEGIVVLAFDISGSMAATDFSPTRMEAAKAAARSFVGRQPASVQIGVVAFSDSSYTVQAPVTDRTAVIAAINRLGPERGTSLGRGIHASLDAIDRTENPTKGFYVNRSPGPTPEPVPPGSHSSAVVVLLTDGQNNEDPDPIEAAQAAADRGIRIHTVGIGTPEGTTLEINGFRVHTQLDEALLTRIADTTDGTYYDADNQESLQKIYDGLDTQLVVRPQDVEVTSLFAGAGVIAILLGAIASILGPMRSRSSRSDLGEQVTA
jgi:Ca-activated chloride channel family protein